MHKTLYEIHINRQRLSKWCVFVEHGAGRLMFGGYKRVADKPTPLLFDDGDGALMTHLETNKMCAIKINVADFMRTCL